jgi:hypothetical protein
MQIERLNAHSGEPPQCHSTVGFNRLNLNQGDTAKQRS